MKMPASVRQFFAKEGAKGGAKATGKKKRRGDSAYYSRLAKRGARQRNK